MKVANLSDVKDQLSLYVDQVRSGETIRILVRGVPAADLVPISAPSEGVDDEAWLADLERRGIIRRGSDDLDPSLFDQPGPTSSGIAASRLIVEERRRR